MKAEEATQVLAELCAQPWRYPARLDESTTRVWIDYLRDVTFEDARVAVRVCGQGMESMPSYAEFRAECRDAARRRLAKPDFERAALTAGEDGQVTSGAERKRRVAELRQRMAELATRQRVS